MGEKQDILVDNLFTNDYELDPVKLDLLSILNASMSISQESDFNLLTEKLIRILLNSSSSESAYLVLMRNNLPSLEIGAKSIGTETQIISEFHIDYENLLNSRIIRTALKTKEPYYINELKTSSYASDEYAISINLQSFMSIPLMFQDRLTGVLYFEHTRDELFFTERKIHILSLLAVQISASVENARLLFDMTNEVEQRKRAEHQLMVMQDDLEKKVASRTAELEELNESLSEEIKYRMKTEASLKASEYRLQLAMEVTGDIVYDLNFETHQNFISSNFDRILQYDADEIEIRTELFNELMHPDDKDRIVLEIESHKAKNDGFYEIEYRFRRKDGSYNWLLDRGKVIDQFTGGETKRVIGTMVDIDRRKRQEHAIQSLIEETSGKFGDEFFRTIVQHIAIVTNTRAIGISQLVPLSAEMMETIVYYDKNEFIDSFSYPIKDTPCETIFGKTSQVYPNDLQKLFPKDQFLIDKGFNSYWGIPLFDRYRKPIGHMFILDEKEPMDVKWLEPIVDIMALRIGAEIERLNVENELIKAKEEAEEASKVKGEFYSKMSHELRTPLNGILGYSNILKNELGLNKDTYRGLDIIDRSGRKLLALINNVFDENRKKPKIIKEEDLIKNKPNILDRTSESNIKKGGTILIIDDLWENIFVFKKMFSFYNLDILEASNADSAFEILATKTPDIIFTDLFLPEVDGFEITRKIKSNPLTANIPVIALTASINEEDREKSMLAGCDGFLTKPFESYEVIQLINKYLPIEENDQRSKSNQKDKEEVVEFFPSKEIIVILYNFARIGDVKSLFNAINDLEESDIKFKEFCKVIRNYANNYKMKQIRVYLHKLIKESN
jgi:PAS domain S-box-containing protein